LANIATVNDVTQGLWAEFQTLHYRLWWIQILLYEDQQISNVTCQPQTKPSFSRQQGTHSSKRYTLANLNVIC